MLPDDVKVKKLSLRTENRGGMIRPALLALDGGGSKVDAALVDVDGRVLGAARWDVDRPAPVLKPVRADGDEASGIDRAVAAACRDAGIDPEARPVADMGMYCLAGADLAEDYERFEQDLSHRGWSAETVVRNDTWAVLRAGSERSWGVAVVCGSGINCAAVGPDGRTLRFPALGRLSGDWGGGYDIGSAAMWHAVRAEDGRGRPTVLERSVPQHFGLERPRELVEAFYFRRLDQARLVELPPAVFAAAQDGDDIATSIVERQADEVVTMVEAAVRRLGLADHRDLDVVLGGGVFQNRTAGFLDRIEQGVRRVASDPHLRVVTDPPVVGAVLLGLDRLGALPEARDVARAALTHGRLAGVAET